MTTTDRNQPKIRHRKWNVETIFISTAIELHRVFFRCICECACFDCWYALRQVFCAYWSLFIHFRFVGVFHEKTFLWHVISRVTDSAAKATQAKNKIKKQNMENIFWTEMVWGLDEQAISWVFLSRHHFQLTENTPKLIKFIGIGVFFLEWVKSFNLYEKMLL